MVALINEAVTLVHPGRQERETTHNVITGRHVEEEKTAARISRSESQMAVDSVDLDRRRFLYFSFVVCFGRVAQIGIFSVAILSERLNRHGAGNQSGVG